MGKNDSAEGKERDATARLGKAGEFVMQAAAPPAPAASRHSRGVPIEHISRLVGHSGTLTTETIYRKQIRPVIVQGADAMDSIFPATNREP
jgi:hypothetical protein